MRLDDALAYRRAQTAASKSVLRLTARLVELPEDLGWLAGSMPRPWSRTWTTTLSDSDSTSILTVAMVEEYLPAALVFKNLELLGVADSQCRLGCEQYEDFLILRC